MASSVYLLRFWGISLKLLSFRFSNTVWQHTCSPYEIDTGTDCACNRGALGGVVRKGGGQKVFMVITEHGDCQLTAY